MEIRKRGETVKLGRWELAVLALLTAAFLASAFTVNFFGFERFCDADMYEDTLVARLMWERRTVFPDNWVFGNQYYVVTTPVLAALFYGVTGSMNLSMALATTAMTALILLSLWWALRPFAGGGEILLSVLTMLGAVMGPDIVWTAEGQLFYIMASYYAGYVITLLVVFGDYMRALGGRNRRFFTAPLALSLVLSFCTGMQSIRQTAVMAVPLAAREALVWLESLVKTKKLPGKGRLLVTARAALVCAANLAGVAAIRLMDIPQRTIYGGLSLVSGARQRENIETGFRALRSITGFKLLLPSTPNRSVVLGVFAVLLIALAAWALWCGFRTGTEKREAGGVHVLVELCGLSLLTLLTVNAFFDISFRGVYLFVWYPLAAAAVIPALRAAGNRGRTVLLAALALGFAANLWISWRPSLEQAVDSSETVQGRIADWIVENGYDYIYSEWNTCENIAARTDGRVVGGSWFQSEFRILEYINIQDIYSEEDNRRAVIVLKPWNREAALRFAAQNGAEMTHVASFGDFELYESSKQLMYFG